MLPPLPGPIPPPSPGPISPPVPVPIPSPVPGPDDGSVLFDLKSPYGSTRASGGTSNGSATTVAATGNDGFLIGGGFGSGATTWGPVNDARGGLPNEAGL